MKVSSLYGSYFKSEDFEHGPRTLVISRFEHEDVGSDKKEMKPVLYFEGHEKGLVLNATNKNTLLPTFGDESDDWPGQAIEIYVADVQFGEKMVKGLRVRLPGTQATQPAQSTQPAGGPPPPEAGDPGPVAGR